MGWRWNPRAKRYQDDENGRFMTRDYALTLVDQSISITTDRVQGLSSLVGNGRLSPRDWESRMRDEIKTEYIRQYGFGRGGLANMKQSDWGRIGGMLQKQYRYLDRFAQEIRDGNLTEGQIATRANMYINSARQAFERGRAVAIGVPVSRLPAYPGDGTTECLTSCKCSWVFVEITDGEGNITGWECYWELEPMAEHCDTCLTRAGQWSPFIIEV